MFKFKIHKSTHLIKKSLSYLLVSGILLNIASKWLLSGLSAFFVNMLLRQFDYGLAQGLIYSFNFYVYNLSFCI